MDWIVENRELLQTIVTLLVGALATYLSVRTKFERNWKAAFAAALQAGTEMAKDAIQEVQEDVIKDVAGEVWDAMLKNSFFATFWGRERFQQFVWDAWSKMAIAQAASSIRLVQSGRLTRG